MTAPIVPLGHWRRDTPPELPQPLTTLVGRDRQVEEVCALLSGTASLVTVTGPAGVGKTRFALAVAHQLQPTLPDGAAAVPLVGVADPTLLPQAIARGLGVRDEGDRPLIARLTGYLRNREMLLVIDNFEHLIDAAPLVSTLLAASPGVRVLVTSSIALKVQGEHEYPLEPLAVPVSGGDGLDQLAGIDAVQLFVQRATAVRPDFELTDANAGTVAEICARLDGLPLAIELAAARSKVLSPSELLDRLDQGFALLVSPARDVPERQQTLHNAIEWGYNLLQPQEQALFRALSVFSGGWTLEAAEAVCAGLDVDVLEGLASLTDQSLVRQREQADGRLRFSMLQTLRAFSREKLVEHGELTKYRTAHAAWFAGIARIAGDELIGAESTAWLDRLDNEHDNARVALDWACTTGDGMSGLVLCSGLWRYWSTRGYVSEGRRWMETVNLLPGASVREPDRAYFLFGLGRLLFQHGEYDDARTAFHEAIEISRDTGLNDILAGAWLQLGTIDLWQGDFEGARRYIDAGLELRRQHDDRWGTATALLNRGRLSELEGNPAEARRYFDECLALFRSVQFQPGEARTIYHLGNVARDEGRLDEAMALYRRSLEPIKEDGDREGLGLVMLNMGLASWMRDELDDAARLIAEGIGCFQELGTPAWIAGCIEVYAQIVADLGKPELAVRMSAVAAGVRDTRSTPIPPAHRDRHDRLLSRLRQDLGNERYVLAWEQGRHTPLDSAIAVVQQPLQPSTNAPDGSPGARVVSPLTRREVEILELVAEGLSNQEIAAQLFISPRTTTTHISNILRKLAVSSRTAAVAAARRDGLIA